MAAKSNNRWVWIATGGAAAVAVGIFLAVTLSNAHKHDEKMNDQPTGLTFTVNDTVQPLDTKKPLRCYVNGAYVGDLTLADCAKKNGVAAQSLDVGLDDNGNPTAAPTASLVPVPGTPVSAAPGDVAPVTAPAQTAEVVPETRAAAGPAAECLRYNSNSWNRLSDSITLGQCVVLLYDQRCVTPGQAQYGRWGNKTLRLVPKRIEVSDDNTTFRPLVDQGKGCSVPLIR